METKNYTRFFGVALMSMAMALNSCSIKESEGILSTKEDMFYAKMEAVAETDTKVYADENLKVLWHENDRVSIFNKNTYNRQYKFDGNTGDNSGSFSVVPDDTFVTGNSLQYAYAVYPYSAQTTISNSGLLEMVLPSTQEYSEGSFGRGANAMVAVAEDNLLLFKNLCGYLMFKLYGQGLSVSSVSLKGNNGELLAGKATVTANPGELPGIDIQAEASDTQISLTCADPVSLGATAEDYTEFWFVLPPVTFSQGITLSVSLSDGSVFEKTTSNAITITRNKRSRMSALEVVGGSLQTPPDNQIWYTTTDGNIITPTATDVFGAGIVSNTYENGQGVIVFDGTVTTIGDKAFQNGATLQTLLMPDTVTSLGSDAFQYCAALETISLSKNLRTIKSMALYRCSSLKELNLPETLTAIYDYAFCYCSTLKEVTIPQSVTYIGGGAFCDCTGLERFKGKYAAEEGRILIDGSTLMAFAPYGLSSYSVSAGVTRINSGVFAGFENLTSVTLPDGLEYIGMQAFSNCTGLTEMHIPESVTYLGSGALRYCSKLASVNLPSGLTSIPGELFGGDPIQSIVIPAGVTSIGSYAFSGTALTSIVIPAGVTNLGAGAFESSSNLTQVIIKNSNPANLGARVFDYTNDCPIYVPAGTEEAYKAASGWTAYADRIFGPASSVAGALTSPDNRPVEFDAVVYAVGSRGFIVSDGSDYILAYTTNVPCAIGDRVHLSGIKTTYRNVPEITNNGLDVTVLSSGNDTSVESYDDITLSLDNFASDHVVPVKVSGTVSGTNVIVEGASLNVYVYWPNESLNLSSFEGKKVILKGFYLFKYGQSQDIMATSIEEDDGTAPYLRLAQDSYVLNGDVQSFTVTVYANVNYHADIAGNASWISAGAVSGSAADGYQHMFTVTKNEGDVRTGVISFCSDDGECHPVTVTQGKYVEDFSNTVFVHHSLGMRFTATWCGWCPVMNESFIKAREKAGEKYNYVMLHASSSSLPFAGTAALSTQYEITGYPTGIIDGRRRVGNGTDTDAVSDLIVNYINETESNYPVVTASAVRSVLNGRSLSLDVDVYAKLAEQYKITVFLIEDGVVASQSDFVAGVTQESYVHDKIARMALTSATGDAFEAETPCSVKSFHYDSSIPESYNIGNMSVLVYVQRKFGNQEVLQTSAGYGDFYIDNSRIVPLGTNAELETK